MDWQRIVARIAAEVEDRVDRVRTEIGRQIGRERPVRVVPYRGYGTQATAPVRGRVVRGAVPGPATPEDRWWVNLANTYRRIESDEVPHARVRVRFRGAETEATTDAEGHFAVEIRPVDRRCSTSPAAPGTSTTCSPSSCAYTRSPPGPSS